MAKASSTSRSLTFKILLIIVVAPLAIQLVPYGRQHSNPPALAEPKWDSPATRQLTLRACGDCHSNETRWPWYSNIAPVSWLVARDVAEGREHFNVSEWGRLTKNQGDRAAEAVEQDEMPPWFYLVPHPEARLSDQEKAALIKGLEKTFGRKEHDHDHRHD